MQHKWVAKYEKRAIKHELQEHDTDNDCDGYDDGSANDGNDNSNTYTEAINLAKPGITYLVE